MRYVLPDGAFWEVTLNGKTVHARWGKGAAVKTRTAPFKTVAAAKRELEALLQKVKALGYRPEKKPEGVAEALRSTPGDDSPLVVHADELLSQGDLRGELAALVARGKKVELQKFLLAHAPALFGIAEEDVHEGRAGDLVWAPGYVREVTFSAPYTADASELVAVVKRFLTAPVAEFVREVNFGVSYESWAAAAEQVTRAKHPELVNALRFSAEEVAVADLDAGDFSEVWARLPELREFRIETGAMTPGELVLPELRSFSRLGGGFSGAELRALANARWPKLERLELGFLEEGADPGVLLTAIFQKSGSLTHLALRDLVLTPEQVEALLDSALLPRLRTLDLSGVVLDEEAAEVLSDGAEQLAHLARLSSPFLADEEGQPTMPVLEDLENLVDDAFDG
jgi:predicted DNA-binding WGR domain protein